MFSTWYHRLATTSERTVLGELTFRKRPTFGLPQKYVISPQRRAPQWMWAFFFLFVFSPIRHSAATSRRPMKRSQQLPVWQTTFRRRVFHRSGILAGLFRAVAQTRPDSLQNISASTPLCPKGMSILLISPHPYRRSDPAWTSVASPTGCCTSELLCEGERC